MRNLLLLTLFLLAGLRASAQVSCTASYTATLGPGANQVTFTNTSVVGAGMPSPTVYSFLYPDFTFGTSVAFPIGGSYTHTFPGPGTYFTHMGFYAIDTVSGAVVSCSDSTGLSVTIPASPCSATFTKSGGGATRTFTATPTGTGTGFSYSWDFGDGTTGTGSPVSHTYSGMGVYPVTLTSATTSTVCTSTTSDSVMVSPCDVASLSANFSSSTPDMVNFTFTNTSTTPPTGTTAYYSWKVDYVPVAGATTMSYSFASAGSHVVELTVYYVDMTGAYCMVTSTQVFTSATPPCTVVIGTPTTSGGGTYTFTAIPVPGTTGLTYSWTFGDGTTGTGSPVSHTYASSGYYPITVTASSSTLGCSDKDSITMYITVPVSCAAATPSFSILSVGFYGDVMVMNTSTPPSTGMTSTSTWNWGDGSPLLVTTSPTPYPFYNYPSSGTYTITLVENWTGGGLSCSDTTSQIVTVTVPNVISGSIITDSLSGMFSTDSFRVYLIEYDAVSTLLTAVDSQTVPVSGGYGYYTFNSKAAGQYRTKAFRTTSSPATASINYIPTYHDSSAYWSTATVINHTGGLSWSKDIYPLTSPTAFTGPGFVGGSVLAGANKGTAEGDPVKGLLVLLRSATTGKVVASATTNNAGAYSFGSVPLGSYHVYPELMNYATTPISVNLTSGAAVDNNNAFAKNDGDMEIVPRTVGIGDEAAADRFSLLPNPTTGVATLKVPAATTGTVSVATVTGAVVVRQDITGASATLDLRSLQPGFYFVTLRTAEGSHTEKLLLQR